MNNQDKSIGRIYTELYGNVHADTEFRKKILTMTETGIKRTKSSFKTICILAAAVLLITSGGIIVSATRGVYDTVVVNGEEKKARYGDFGNGTRIWGYEDGNTMYTVYVYGDFDTEKDTLHFVDYGEYFLASTNTEPTLNLYKDIDKSENSYIKEENGEKILCIKDDSGIQEIMLSFDAQDGTEDGKIGDTETLAVLPNGSIVNTMKYKISILDKIANRFGGGVFSGTQSENSWDWEHFWGSFDGGNFADNFFSDEK